MPPDHEDAWLWTASIITTDATDEIGRIHDRTPMVIAPESWEDWLDPANNDRELLLATMQPATSSGAGGLTSHPVSTAVNSVRNNGPDLIAALPPEPPPDGDPVPEGPVPAATTGRPCSESVERPAARFLPCFPGARGREARSSVEIGVARKRLEAMRDDLDKSIVVLQAEHPRARGGGDGSG